MEYKFDIGDMAIELSGAAQILTEVICDIDDKNIAHYCDMLTAVRGLVSRISDELQTIYDDEYWKKPAKIDESKGALKKAVCLEFT